MPYSSEVIGRARQRLENEKTEKRSRYYANLEQAYREVPELRQIDMLMKRNVAQAVQGAFTEVPRPWNRRKKKTKPCRQGGMPWFPSISPRAFWKILLVPIAVAWAM